MQKIIILLFAISVIFFLRSPEEARTHFVGVAMTVPYQIQIRGSLSNEEQAQVKIQIESVFNEIDATFNKWNPESELSLLNRFSAHEAYLASKPLYDYLVRMEAYWKETEGLFDPTVEGRKVSGWDQIILKEGTVIKLHPEVQLDLGGVVKGTAIDRLVESLSRLGFDSILVDWGGDFASILKEGEKPWKLALYSPEGKKETLLDLYNGGIATSGDYLQKWDEGKTTFFHIYDPINKEFLKQEIGTFTSCTAIASTAEEADVVATAILLLRREEEAKRFLKKLQEKRKVEVIWETRTSL